MKLEGAIEQYLCEHRDEIADKLIEILSDRITETIEQKKTWEKAECGKNRMVIAMEMLNGEREFVTGEDVTDHIGRTLSHKLQPGGES